jgi:DNA-binding CsgD family transcriptional regulator
MNFATLYLYERRITTIQIPMVVGLKELDAFKDFAHEHPFVNAGGFHWKTQPTPKIRHPLKKSASNHVASYVRSPVGTPVKISDALTGKVWRSLGIYNEFYRNIGAEHQMLTLLYSTNESVTVMTFNRNSRDFGEKERFLLKMLTPHILNTHRLANLQNKPAKAINVGLFCDVSAGRLTARERETLRWVAMGKSNAEIAALLGVKLDTVKKHLLNSYDKLGVENRTAASMLMAEQFFRGK